jgi:flagellin-specific chaperone FliS
VLNEILALGRQNATKLDQLLEYAAAAPTAAQMTNDHTRIEQLIAGAVTRLEEQHKQIQQDINNLRTSSGGGQEGSGGNAELLALSAQLTELGNQMTQLTALMMELQNAAGQPVVANPSEEFQLVLANILAKLDELEQAIEADREPSEVHLTVDTPTFLEPDYIDMSLIWAQQKAAGLKHAVLVVDTESTSWAHLGQAYSAARAKFPPLSLYDVQSRNVVVRTLPQLVVYPKEGGPRVLSDPEEVVAELSRLARLP